MRTLFLTILLLTLPALLSAQDLKNRIPALFDDFSYSIAEFPAHDTSNSLFGNNIWLTDSGAVSSRAWNRFNRDNPDNFGKHSRVIIQPFGFSLAAFKGFRFGDVTAVVTSGFVFKEGTYVSRVRFGKLPQQARAIQAFWLASHDHYRFKDSNDSLTYVNEVDIEWNNHFSGMGEYSINTANIGRYHTRKGLIGKGDLIRFYKKNSAGEFTPVGTEVNKAANGRFWDYWAYYFIRIDSARGVTEYLMETDDPVLKITGGSHLAGNKVAPMQISEHYPTMQLGAIYNFGMWPHDPNDTLLKSDVQFDIDWFYFSPRSDIELTQILKEVEAFRNQGIPRVNTSGIVLDNYPERKHPTVEIAGPDSIAPIQPAVWHVRPSLEAALYDIDYAYRRYTTSGIGEWIALTVPDARVYAQAADTAIEFTAKVKDFWQNKTASTTKLVRIIPFETLNLADVFPSPTSGLAVLKLPDSFKKEELNVTIYTIHGAQIKKYSTNEEKYVTIQLEDQPPGVYVVSITAGSERMMAKVNIVR